MFPFFQKYVNGCVCLTDTYAAKLVKDENRQRSPSEPENYNNLRIAARRQCREAGGDNTKAVEWMGFLRIQFGTFRYNKEDKAQEQKVLLQGLSMPKPAVTASGLPEARQKPAELPSSEAPRFHFPNPTSTAGQAPKKTNRKRKAETPVTPSSAKRHSITPTSVNIRYPVIMSNNQLLILPAKPKQQQLSEPQPSKRNYKTSEFIKCSKCGQNRKNSTTHKSYMFKIFCQNSEMVTFEEWRGNIKRQMDEESKLKKKN